MVELISHEHARWSKKPLLLLLLLDWISHDHLKLIVLVKNGRSSCEIMILMLNFRFVNLEGSKRPMRGCQVSTWPWPINRNLNFSCKSFLTLWLCNFLEILSLNRIFYFFFIFPHFLTSQTCLVRWNLQAWVANFLFFFCRRKENLKTRPMVNYRNEL